MIAFCRRCWEQRWIRICYWTFCILLPLVIVPYSWLHLRGKHEWHKVVKKYREAGESLDPKDFESPAIPDEENFCAIPALKDIALAVDGDLDKGEPAAKRARFWAMKIMRTGKPLLYAASRSSQLGTNMNWQEWEAFLREIGLLKEELRSKDPPEALLDALAPHESLCEELEAGLSRPKAQWTPPLSAPGRYDYQPHFGTIFLSVVPLVLRVRALVATRRHSEAHQGVRVLIRFAGASDSSLGLSGFSLHAQCLSHAADGAWELCHSRAGTKSEFTALRQDFAELDSLRTCLHYARCHVAWSTWVLRDGDRTRAEFELLAPMGGIKPVELRNFVRSLIPRGWYHWNAASYADLHFDYCLKPMRENKPREVIRLDPTLKALSEQRATSFPFTGLVSYTGVFGAIPRALAIHALHSQTLRNQAILACALEEHFLEHQSYPESLAELSGGPWPDDPITKKPMSYRRTPNGRYKLWSVGIDGVDDGGERTLDAKNPEHTMFHSQRYKGDWVWDYPEE